MRRKDRAMPEAFAWLVVDKCEWAVLAMQSPAGEPYALPLSIAAKDGLVYFHCAKNGFKTECLRHKPAVCLVCVGETNRPPDKFTTEYESAILRGIASEVTDEQEKIQALRLLCERHNPANMPNFAKAIARSLDKTAVWKITLSEISGKRKKYDAQGKEMKFARME